MASEMAGADALGRGRGRWRLRRRPHPASEPQRRSRRPSACPAPDRQAPRRRGRPRAQGPHQDDRDAAGSRWRRVRRQGRAAWLTSSRRRSEPLGHAARPFRDASASITTIGLQPRRRLHQPSRELFISPSQDGGRAASPRIPQYLHQYANHAAWLEDHRRLEQRCAGVSCARAGAQASGQPAVERILAAGRAIARAFGETSAAVNRQSKGMPLRANNSAAPAWRSTTERTRTTRAPSA